MATTKDVRKLLDDCEAAGWEVQRGGSGHYKVKIPGRALPLSVPSTANTHRSLDEVRTKLNRAGLAIRLATVKADAEVRRKEVIAAARASRPVTAPAQPPATEESMVSVLGKHGMKLTFELVTPDMAQEWLDNSERSVELRLRRASQTLVDQYAFEMAHGEWKEYLPDGVIGLTANKSLVNGQKRMRAVVQYGKPVGFVVCYNVPVDMYPYFDGAQRRSIADTFTISGMPSGFEVQSAIKLAMRYEEMLRGERPRDLWTQWGGVKTTNAEALAFYRRRAELGDLFQEGRAQFYGSKLIVSTAMVFKFYADRAWRDRPGAGTRSDPLEAFWVGLRDGEDINRSSAAYTIREWSKDMYSSKERVKAKREMQLLVLWRGWRAFVGNNRYTVQHQPGWPMPYPYHPDGDDTAIANALRG